MKRRRIVILGDIHDRQADGRSQLCGLTGGITLPDDRAPYFLELRSEFFGG